RGLSASQTWKTWRTFLPSRISSLSLGKLARSSSCATCATPAPGANTPRSSSAARRTKSEPGRSLRFDGGLVIRESCIVAVIVSEFDAACKIETLQHDALAVVEIRGGPHAESAGDDSIDRAAGAQG